MRQKITFYADRDVLERWPKFLHDAFGVDPTEVAVENVEVSQTFTVSVIRPFDSHRYLPEEVAQALHDRYGWNWNAENA